MTEETPEAKHERITRLCHEGRDSLAEACRKFAKANDDRHPDNGATILTVNEQMALSYLRAELRKFEIALNELHYER